VLGLPPTWYKSAPYRSRVVRDPRRVLAEFDVRLPDDVDVRVWDSTAEVRYLVIPQRPEGTDGWSEEQLAGLVTRDSMIGVGFPLDPSSVPAVDQPIRASDHGLLSHDRSRRRATST
jgi:nitrile hydratase